MTFNYRVFRQRFDDEEQLVVHEVYYDYDSEDPQRPASPDDKRIETWSVRNVKPSGDTLEELRGDLELMLKALEAPILEESELERVIAEDGRTPGIRRAKG